MVPSSPLCRFRHVLCSVIVCLTAVPLLMAAAPTVIKDSRHDTSAPLRDIASLTKGSGGTDREAAFPRETNSERRSGVPDPVAQELTSPLTGVTVVANFEGQSADDNRGVFGFAFVPPDTNGAAGTTQYLQMVNVTLSVYDKRTGKRVLGPAAISSVWSGFGGLCETEDGGDPIVLYDRLAGRWLISQFQFAGANLQCVAISATSDATGAYHRYEFNFGADFPDYPKFGVWPDAYYYTANLFGPSGFAGAAACAFDRARMLNGEEAIMICFRNPNAGSLLPSDLDGSTLPPAGSPNYFLDIADASGLNIYEFRVNFANPASSTFTAPVRIPVAPFNDICQFSFRLACIQQPERGEKVDAIADRLMFRLAYRNLGTHESLVVNHTIEGGAMAGARWYEIRSPGSAPFVFQQGTVVDPEIAFWMGSIAMDKAGNIALGFSASEKRVHPSIFAVGRRASDPKGTMFGPLVLANGTGVQQASFHRWGDYSSMVLDPTDDCTFWYTQEYQTSTGFFDWKTRIAAFRFDNCKKGGR
jgi:hypothetical protein